MTLTYKDIYVGQTVWVDTQELRILSINNDSTVRVGIHGYSMNVKAHLSDISLTPPKKKEIRKKTIWVETFKNKADDLIFTVPQCVRDTRNLGHVEIEIEYEVEV